MDSNSFKTKAVNLKTIQKSWFIVNAENKVLGVQFDIIYNTSQLDMNELICPIDGTTFEYSIIEDGWLRCIAFNLDGKSFSRAELSRLVLASFSQKNNFYKHTNVEFKNYIIAGDYGEDVSDQYKINSFRINFSGLKPKNTYIPTNINEILNEYR